jgi:tetratricopeptide (TPR) repeat protein
MPEGWRMAFQRGTLLAFVGRHEEAALMLERARAWRPSPETLNNLGVVLHQLGRHDAALSLFEEALRQFPQLVDARRNRDSTSPVWLTPLPLRAHLSRDQY